MGRKGVSAAQRMKKAIAKGSEPGATHFEDWNKRRKKYVKSRDDVFTIELGF